MRTRIIQDGADQIVLIPDAIAYPDDTEVELTRSGDVITLRPTRAASEDAGAKTSVRE